MRVCVRSLLGYRREGTEGAHRGPGQEEVPGAGGLDRRTILFLDPQTYPSATRRCPFLLREQRDPAHVGDHGLALPGASRRGLLPVHCLL